MTVRWLVPAYDPESPGHAWYLRNLVGTPTALCGEFECPALHLERCRHDRFCRACVVAARDAGYGDAEIQRARRILLIRVACGAVAMLAIVIGQYYLKLA